jgi:hypothetical protein
VVVCWRSVGDSRGFGYGGDLDKVWFRFGRRVLALRLGVLGDKERWGISFVQP